MNLRDLEYVIAIDRYRNFGRAAKACNVSQPALSAQVKKLEERLGIEIFNRTNQKVEVTDAGDRIITMAKEMIGAAQRINDYAAEQRDPFSVPIRVGMTPTLAPFLIPYICGIARNIGEDIRLIFQERSLPDLASAIMERDTDIALVHRPVDTGRLKFTPLFDEPLLLAVPNSHRLANCNIVEPGAMPCEEMITLSGGHCLCQETLTPCLDRVAGADITDDLSATSLLTVAHFIAHGYGCTLIPQLGADIMKRVNPNIRILAIEGRAMLRRIGFLGEANGPRSQILERFDREIRNSPPPGVYPVPHTT